MSEEEGRDAGSESELDPIDALILAAMDRVEAGETRGGPESERRRRERSNAREALQRLAAEDEAVAERIRAFERVDAGVRALADDPSLDRRLAANFETLKARLDAARSSGGGGVANPGPARWFRKRAVPVLVAAAALLALYFGLSGPSPSTRSPLEPSPAFPSIARSTGSGTPDEASSPGTREVGSVEPEFDEELVWALGYVEEDSRGELVPNEWVEDLEIIEQLEVLDFLSNRDSAARNPEERG